MHRKVKNSGYFLISDDTEKCIIKVARGIQINVLYYEKKKTNLGDAGRTGELKLPAECVFLRRKNVQHAGRGVKRDHGMRYHLYLFPDNVVFTVAVAFAYGDSYAARRAK